MKAIITTLALAMSLTAFAQTEVLKIELNDGTTQTVPVDNIKQMTFGTEDSSIDGKYTGKVAVTIAAPNGSFTYEAENDAVEVTTNADGTLDVKLGGFSLAGTMMGDLTLGELTIRNIAYDEAKQAYYRNYSNDGLTRYFTNGTTMNKDYPLGETSEITLRFDGGNVEIQNDYKLGTMPFPLTSKYTGTK